MQNYNLSCIVAQLSDNQVVHDKLRGREIPNEGVLVMLQQLYLHTTHCYNQVMLLYLRCDELQHVSGVLTISIRGPVGYQFTLAG